ncbi:MAG TPA: class I SAM-dependent methyltransferase, partial [Pyrinomonadaceae bacterium]|nr:class I SAM-dependent methyltransferase [Pyrinomonadaceae bacterium]
MDLGTGDGRFVCDLAKQEPDTFLIGIDANRKPLEKPSVKITRKPAKGGLGNAMFIQAAAEDLPDGLFGIADRVTINLPWGSLLRAVVLPDAEVLRGIRRLIKPGGILEVVTAIDAVRDRQELERLGLPSLTDRHLDVDLIRSYQ